VKPQHRFTDLVYALPIMDPRLLTDVSRYAKVARGQRATCCGWSLMAIDINWDL
jgi:hypothetical protein